MEHRNNFQAQWQELTSIIESEVIRDLRTLNKVDTNKLDKLFEEEKQKWNSSINYRGVWLKSLSDKSPCVAYEFRQTLSDFKLSHTSICMPSKRVYILTSTVIFIVAIVIAFYIDVAFWRSIIGAIILSISLSSVIFSLYEKQAKSHKNKIVQFYSRSLSDMTLKFNSLL